MNASLKQMFFSKRTYYKKLTDEQLIELIRSDLRSRCLGEIYERYGHLVMGVCLKYLQNRMDAEDLTSELFEKLPHRIENHQINHFKSWLYTVVKNECFMLLRKKKIRTDELTHDSLAMDETSLEEKHNQENTLDKLESSLSELKEEQSNCVKMFYLEKKSYEQISSELHIPLKQVKSAIQNGKRNLKILLDQTLEENK